MCKNDLLSPSIELNEHPYDPPSPTTPSSPTPAPCDTLQCQQICRNRGDGTAVCLCNQGYKLTGDGRTCRDIDECQIRNVCDHFCHNTPGSFHCSCRAHYTLDKNGRTCCPSTNPPVGHLPRPPVHYPRPPPVGHLPRPPVHYPRPPPVGHLPRPPVHYPRPPPVGHLPWPPVHYPRPPPQSPSLYTHYPRP